MQHKQEVTVNSHKPMQENTQRPKLTSGNVDNGKHVEKYMLNN